MAEAHSCARCLYTTAHPLGLVLDAEGICSGCRIHEEKNSLDWDARWERLVDLVKPYRSSSGRTYDCIVPVTGSQDSYYIVHTVKNRLGLNPLLVTYNKYFNTPLGIRNLANLRIKLNCDILFQNVNPVSVKKIVRSTLRDLGSIYWPILAGHTVFPVQVAVRYKVPLIIWGAHQGLEQVGMFSHEHEVEMTRRYRKDHDLMGREADDLLSVFDVLKEEDVWQYRYPSDRDVGAVGVRGFYLGNFVRWDPKAQHELMIKHYDYRTSSFPRTFDCYDYVDCFNYMDTHDLLKLYKHGYSKVTDHACREIRFGRFTRDEGLRLVRKHQQEPLRYMDLFCEWLGITRSSMKFMLGLHRNPRWWRQSRFDHWEFSGCSELTAMSRPTVAQAPVGDCVFHATDPLEYGRECQYIVFGKGYP